MTSIHDYSDIIDIPRPEPRYHQRMPLADRAAQFAPFAALTGYSDVISEAGRSTDEKRILDEREKDRINRTLNALTERIRLQPFVTVTCFEADQRKAGGSTITVSGKLKKIDSYEQRLEFVSGVKVPFDDIYEIREG